MVTSSTRWWRHRRSTGLVVFPVLLLALARGSVADIAMDARVQHIVTADLAPETVGKAGGLAVAVYAAGHTQFFNYGFADGTTKRPITSDTLFNLASVRKPFEAILVALGTLRGELSLDDPVSRYVPELRGDYIKRVTIGELATHTSGLLLPTDHPPWPNDSFTLQQFFDMLNAWTPQAGEQPGKQRIYTHAGYVLQLALERRYGRPIGELIEEHILKPLGMNQTFLPERGPDNRAIMVPELLKNVSCRATPIRAWRLVHPETSRAITISPGRVRCSPRRVIWPFSGCLYRWRGDRSAIAASIADDAARGVSRHRKIRTGDGLGKRSFGRRGRCRQARRT